MDRQGVAASVVRHPPRSSTAGLSEISAIAKAHCGIRSGYRIKAVARLN